MVLVFVERGPARKAAIDAVELRLGTRLPAPFRNLLTTVSNGGEVEPAAAQSAPAVGVVAVLGAERGDHLDIESRLAQYAGDRLPPGLIPVIDAEGGNLVCLSLRPDDFGTVWFWDHEQERAGHAVTMLAAGFDDFLDDLAPPAPNEEPGSVVEAWIDPSLRAELDGDKS